MEKWLKNFNYDPIEPLINHESAAVAVLAKKDLLNENISLIHLWQEPEAQKIIRRQNNNGSWDHSKCKKPLEKWLFAFAALSEPGINAVNPIAFCFLNEF